MATALLQLGLVVALLVGSFAGLGLLHRAFSGQLRLDRLARRRARGQAPLPAEPARRPVEQVAADVRRLARQLALVPAGAPAARRRGWQAAYDDVLGEAARLLDVPHTLGSTPPGLARELERLRLESALQDAGLDLRR